MRIRSRYPDPPREGTLCGSIATAYPCNSDKNIAGLEPADVGDTSMLKLPGLAARIALAAACLLPLALPASALDYPTRQPHIIVG